MANQLDRSFYDDLVKELDRLAGRTDSLRLYEEEFSKLDREGWALALENNYRVEFANAVKRVKDKLATVKVNAPEPPPEEEPEEPEPPAGLKAGEWKISGNKLEMGPLLPGQSAYKIAARNVGPSGPASGPAYYQTLPASAKEYTFTSVPSGITSKSFQVTLGRPGASPEWTNDWRNITLTNVPDPAPEPAPEPEPTPPPSSGGGTQIYTAPARSVTFQKGSSGGGGGMAFWPKFPASSRVRLEYFIEFPASFRWSSGGQKFPGVGGGSNPTGCTHNTAGFTARGQAEGFGDRARADGYLYSSVQPSGSRSTGGCGYIVQGTQYFIAGRKHHVSYEVWRGTRGQANGGFEIKIDGVVTARHSAVNWATGADALIDTLVGQAFFGGTNTSPQTQTAIYGPFTVYKLG